MAIASEVKSRLGVSQWVWLVLVTAVLFIPLEAGRFPAAPLLAAITAGIVLATRSTQIPKISKPYLSFSQGVIGCMIARSLHPAVFAAMAQDWAMLLFMTFAVVLLSNLLGGLLAARKVLPGSTAIWGSAPGGATAMVIMAEAEGADIRLTALMQYLRVVMVAVIAAAMAKINGATTAASVLDLFSTPQPFHLLLTVLLIAVVSIVVAPRLKVPAGALLITMLVSTLLQDFAGFDIELPTWVLFIAYIIIGWTIGLRFTMQLLRYAASVLPKLFMSIALLMSACGLLAWGLHRWTGHDALTSYLATSPGGIDSVTIIAASTHVDMPFVLSTQVARLLMVLAIQPMVARYISRRFAR